jgi:hypothetical protein
MIPPMLATLGEHDCREQLAGFDGSGRFVVCRLRIPDPLGFYSRGLDGRIDHPKAGMTTTR